MRLPFGIEIVKRGGDTYIQRPSPRPPRAAKRSFSAAQNTDLTNSWTSTPQSINQMLEAGQTSLRARSRDLAINTDHGSKFINLVKKDVVGPNGVVLQARSQNPDGSLDRLANESIETEFKAWGESDTCSMCGTLGWIDIQDLFISAVAMDGEAIFRKVYGAGGWGLALSQIDPSLLDIGYSAILPNGSQIRMGIEIDGWQRPIAYHFRDDGYGKDTHIGKNGRNYLRVPANQIIHGFIPEMPNQLRGVPWMAPSMMRMKMFAAFEEAAVVNARIGASKVGVITTPDGQYTGDDADSSTGDQLMDADPGTWITMADGETIDAWDPAYPSGEFADFSKSILQSISSGLGVDYAGLTSNLEGVNYSSIRAGLVETRENWKKIQGWVIRGFVRPVYLEWLTMALLAQKIRVGTYPLKFEREWKYQRVTFQGRRWAWVDPKNDLQAAKLAIEEGIASRTEIIRDRGRDPFEVWDEIENENKILADKNITVGTDAVPVMEDEDGKETQD